MRTPTPTGSTSTATSTSRSSTYSRTSRNSSICTTATSRSPAASGCSTTTATRPTRSSGSSARTGRPAMPPQPLGVIDQWLANIRPPERSVGRKADRRHRPLLHAPGRDRLRRPRWDGIINHLPAGDCTAPSPSLDLAESRADPSGVASTSASSSQSQTRSPGAIRLLDAVAKRARPPRTDLPGIRRCTAFPTPADRNPKGPRDPPEPARAGSRCQPGSKGASAHFHFVMTGFNSHRQQRHLITRRRDMALTARFPGRQGFHECWQPIPEAALPQSAQAAATASAAFCPKQLPAVGAS